MPDIGLVELALIGLVGFLVLGPERLPEFFGQIGRILRDGKTWLNSLKNQLEYEKNQLSQPLQDIKGEIKASVADPVREASPSNITKNDE